MMIQLANFDKIETIKGRHTSEHILKEASHRIKKSFRKSDIISKYKDDTFVVIMPETTVEKTSVVEKRIIDLIDRTPFIHKEEIQVITNIKIQEILQQEDETEDTVLNRLEAA